MISASVIYVGHGWKVAVNGRALGPFKSFVAAWEALQSKINDMGIAFILGEAEKPTEGKAGSLLPCPFCGGEASVIRKGTDRQSCIVSCDMCGCRLESNEQGAGRDWNMRK